MRVQPCSALCMGAEVWTCPLAITDEDPPIYMQWVPSYCRITAGNEAANTLAGEVASMVQETVPLDTTTIYRAATFQARHRVAKERLGCISRTSGASFRKTSVRVCPMSKKIGRDLSKNCPKYGCVRKLSEQKQ